MSIITRSQVLLDFTERAAEVVYFDLADMEYPFGIALPIWRWRELGEPYQITVTIEPGDMLNIRYCLNPTCPCQDGDPCHYAAHGNTPAMAIPREYMIPGYQYEEVE